MTRDLAPVERPDDLYQSREEGPWPKWFAGLAVPVVLSIYGLAFIIIQKATIFGRTASTE